MVEVWLGIPQRARYPEAGVSEYPRRFSAMDQVGWPLTSAFYTREAAEFAEEGAEVAVPEDELSALSGISF